MCGIAGWFRRDGHAVDEAVLRAQCSRIVHRGPDDEGVLADGDFGFGMRRLSVVDLSGGHQPMTTADGRWSIVFNGEISNFRTLRSELEAAGRTFITRSDTEVVLQAFAHWQSDAWPRLEGMYAVAIWDHAERVLHLARDPLGIKPLYWALQGRTFAFASELTALGPVPGLAFEIDRLSLKQYATFGAVLAPRSIYAGVGKLLPGTALRVDDRSPPAMQGFWRPSPAAPREPCPPDTDAWVAQCRRELLATVESHLVADVPLGAFLSGGVDSSAVVAAMTRLGAGPVRTFTIGFAEAGFDESAVAAEVASHLGCKHRALRLEPQDAPALLEALAAVHDEPFADDSALATWAVSRLAREEVTVALSGDGGDELFAGYRRYRSELAAARLRQVPGGTTALAGAVALADRMPRPGLRLRHWRKVAADALLPDAAERAMAKQQRAPLAVLDRLWGPAMAELPLRSPRDWLSAMDDLHELPADPLQRMLFVDTRLWLPDDMLTKVDRASMAHSLEVRVPMLAHRFAEWALQVPDRLKIAGGEGKWLLRRAVEDWLPPGILQRPKQGFAVPVGRWLHGAFGQRALDAWHRSGLESQGLFAPGCMDSLLQEHRAGHADHTAILYTLTALAHWWPRRLPEAG